MYAYCTFQCQSPIKYIHRLIVCIWITLVSINHQLEIMILYTVVNKKQLFPPSNTVISPFYVMDKRTPTLKILLPYFLIEYLHTSYEYCPEVIQLLKCWNHEKGRRYVSIANYHTMNKRTVLKIVILQMFVLVLSKSECVSSDNFLLLVIIHSKVVQHQLCYLSTRLSCLLKLSVLQSSLTDPRHLHFSVIT